MWGAATDGPGWSILLYFKMPQWLVHGPAAGGGAGEGEGGGGGGGGGEGGGAEADANWARLFRRFLQAPCEGEEEAGGRSEAEAEELLALREHFKMIAYVANAHEVGLSNHAATHSDSDVHEVGLSNHAATHSDNCTVTGGAGRLRGQWQTL